MARVESRAPCGAQLKSWVPHGGRLKSVKQVMKERRRSWRLDRIGWRSYCLGLWSDRQPLFWAWSDRPNVRSDHQVRLAVESLTEHRAPIVVCA
jgi:hypothetical protein